MGFYPLRLLLRLGLEETGLLHGSVLLGLELQSVLDSGILDQLWAALWPASNQTRLETIAYLHTQFMIGSPMLNEALVVVVLVESHVLRPVQHPAQMLDCR